MPLTLSDLNFTFDTTGIDDLKTEIANSLQITNYIEETPSISVNDLNNIVDYFSSIFNTNLENFANNMKNYFDQQGNNLKNEIKEEDYYKIETSFGKFSRTFSLPEDADIENIEAKSENGVLEIFIPKIKKETPKKKITIK